MEQELKQVCKKVKFGQRQIKIDAKFFTESGKEVGRVLALSCKSFVTSCECLNGVANCIGIACCKLVYVTKKGEIAAISNDIEFKETIESVDISIDAFVECELKLVEATTPVVKSNEVLGQFAIDMNVYINCISNFTCNVIDDIHTKSEVVEVCRKVGVVDDMFEFGNEIDIGEDILNVFDIDYDIRINNTECGSGLIVVSGEVFACILYSSENGSLHSFKTNLSFRQEIGVTDCDSDCVVDIKANILDNLCKSIFSHKDPQRIELILPMKISGLVYRNELFENVEDCYSETSEIEMETTEITKLKCIVTDKFEKQFSEQIEFPTNDENFIIGFENASATITNSYSENDELNIEGIISATILYKEKIESAEEQVEESSEEKVIEEGEPIVEEVEFIIKSFIAEIPFATKNTHVNYNDASVWDVKVSIKDIDIVVKSRNDIVIDAILSFYEKGWSNDEMKMITNCKKVGARELSDVAIEIIVVNEKQSFWDLGKHFGVSVEKIMLQNPELIEPFTSGTQAIIYRGFSN